MGCTVHGVAELDTTEHTHAHARAHTHTQHLKNDLTPGLLKFDHEQE